VLDLVKEPSARDRRAIEKALETWPHS